MSTTRSGPRAGLFGHLLLAIVGLLVAANAHAVRPAGQPGVDWGDPKGQECIDCHMGENPGLYWEWNHSQHGQNGVTCLDCHQAEEGDIDALLARIEQSASAP